MKNVARRVVRSALLFALALSIPSVPSLAQAAKKDKAAQKGKARKGAQKKVVLAAFTGPKAESARGWAITGLKNDDSIALISDDKAASVAQGSSESDYASVAGGLGAAALVVGRVNLQKKVGWSLTLWVHNGSDGKLIEKLTVRGGLLPGLRKKVEESIGDILAPALAKAEAGEAEPAEEAPASKAASAEEVTLDEEPTEGSVTLDDDTEGAEPDDEEEPVASGALGPSPLDLKLGLRFYQRSFNYSDTLNDHDPNVDPLLVHKTAAGSPMFIFSGNLYPLAFFSDGALAHLGVMVGYEYGFLTKTSLPDPLVPGLVRELSQNHTEAYFGLRYRLMLGAHEIIPYVTFGKHTFEIENDKYPIRALPPPNNYRDALPDVAYKYIDVGLAPRLVFGSISVGARAAYRIVNDTGGLQQTSPLNPDGTEVDPYETWFPLAKGNGVSFGVHLGYALTEMLEIQLGFDYTRYGFDFNHIPTAADRQDLGLAPIPPERIAGGATDTYVSGFLALGVRFPGSPVVGAAATPDSVVEDPENEDVEELDF